MGNTTHIGFNNVSLDNVNFKTLNRCPAIGEHVTAKYYANQSFIETSLVRNIHNIDFNNHF